MLFYRDNVGFGAKYENDYYIVDVDIYDENSVLINSIVRRYYIPDVYFGYSLDSINNDIVLMPMIRVPYTKSISSAVDEYNASLPSSDTSIIFDYHEEFLLSTLPFAPYLDDLDDYQYKTYNNFVIGSSVSDTLGKNGSYSNNEFYFKRYWYSNCFIDIFYAHQYSSPSHGGASLYTLYFTINSFDDSYSPDIKTETDCCLLVCCEPDKYKLIGS